MDISVYITSYNQKSYLVEAIESVLSQTLPPKQIIIVDDASQDGSQEVITGFTNRFPHLIKSILHSQNLGVARTRNDALEAINEDFVTFLDGDDRFLPAKLEKEAQRMLNSANTDIIYSNYYMINFKGERLGLWGRSNLPEGDIFCHTFGRSFPKQRLYRYELVRYHSWKQIGFYDPTLQVYEDYDMRIRLTDQLRAAYTQEALSEYRLQDASLSKMNGMMYLDAFNYIRQKNAPLLKKRSLEEQKKVNHLLDEWRAALLRKMGRQALNGKANFLENRKNSFHYYHLSQKYHHKLDVLFWLEFILSPGGYSRLKDLYYKLRKIGQDSGL